MTIGLGTTLVLNSEKMTIGIKSVNFFLMCAHW